MKDKDYIIKELRSSGGAEESSELYFICTVKDGTSELVIKKTISERYPVQDLEKVLDLYERLNCGGGRKIWRLEELAHPYNPN